MQSHTVNDVLRGDTHIQKLYERETWTWNLVQIEICFMPVAQSLRLQCLNCHKSDTTSLLSSGRFSHSIAIAQQVPRRPPTPP